MAFNEATKLEAKRRANFRCVVCHQPWVEVHHIDAQSGGGSDDLDNAAPLCGSCHGQYGGNPDLKKQLKQMRDHWWQLCSQANAANVSDGAVALRLDALQTALVHGQKKQEEVLTEVKMLLTDRLQAAREQILASGTVSGALSVSSALSTGFPPAVGTRPAAPQIERPSMKWGAYKFEGNDGLYCTACYDTKGVRYRTTRLNSRFRQCPVCKAMLGS